MVLRLSRLAKRRYSETFWDDEKGRFIGCVDVDGARHDYGFTFVNVEAMAYGLADEGQARRIYEWMETQPTSTGEADTYTRWLFAPRATTLHNPRWHPEKGKLSDAPQEPWWQFGWRGTEYGDQCQDGGAILYTSFFDLMARSKHLGPDNALERWREILDRWQVIFVEPPPPVRFPERPVWQGTAGLTAGNSERQGTADTPFGYAQDRRR